MRMRYSRFLSLLTAFSVFALMGSAALATITTEGPPAPSIDDATLRAMEAQSNGTYIVPGKTPPPALTPGLIGPAIECYDFDDNAALSGGFVYIPPDPHCAVGQTHVINIVNVGIEWRPKNNPLDTPEYQASLSTFFAGVPGGLGTATFDPKVIYDQYSDRFIVITLERVTSPTLQSRILVAVSKTSNPNAGWWLHSINSGLVISGAVRWADYPGFALDDDAVYVTNNMFNSAGTAYYGSRLWIIPKTGAYSGPNGALTSTVYDPWALVGQSGFATTTQPTHMYGPEPANVGTFLVAYSGLSDGVLEYVNFIRVDNPLGAPVFTFQQMLVGDIETAPSPSFPGVPQLGTTRLIRANDRRALNAVWRNNNLYFCASTLGNSGTNVGQVTAHWWRVSTVNLAALALADQGDAGADDLGAGTHTFFPSVMVDCDDNMALGFSASNAAIYCGAYYATRMATDPAGTIGATGTLALGVDWYVRTFSSSTTATSRWGDYSGLSICPVDQSTFWVYNEYAGPRGTPTTVSGVTEDGRWHTKLGRFMLKQPVSVAITSFSARYADGAVTLRSTFRSDLGVQAVNVYRGNGSGDLKLVDTVFGTDGRGFEYADRGVEPGNAYRYQIGITDADGEFLSPVEEVKVPKMTASLGQNTPNPFNPTTLISFTLPARERVTVSVYDASGRLVRTLVDDVRGVGSHDVEWDGRDNAGVTVGSGVYFYRLTAGKYTESRKMVMLK